MILKLKSVSGICVLRNNINSCSSGYSLLDWLALLVAAMSIHYHIPGHIWQLVVTEYCIPLLHGSGDFSWISSTCKYTATFEDSESVERSMLL